VKEIRIAEDERFVICCNLRGHRAGRRHPPPDGRPAQKFIDGADALSKDTRATAPGDLGQARAELLPARHPGGILRIDPARAEAEKNLGGK
jgi:hypothetical protein